MTHKNTDNAKAFRKRMAQFIDPKSGINSRARHGKASSYVSYGCRCPWCIQANTLRCEEMRRNRMLGRDTETRIQPNAPHGTYGGYVNWGCRCEDCTKANSQKSYEYYRKNLSKAARQSV